MSPEQQKDIEKLEIALRSRPRSEILAFASVMVDAMESLAGAEATDKARQALADTPLNGQQE